MHGVIKKILNEYVSAKKEVFAGHSMGNFFRNEIPQIIYNTGIVDSKQYLITGSVGQGNWANVPWVCIFNRKITTSATKGIYIVYLLSNDGERLYLTFNQGCTNIRAKHSKKETIAIMRERAQELLEQIDSREFKTDESINLGSGLTELAELYQKGTILYKMYEKEDIPSNETLLADLKSIMEIYEEYSEQFLFEKEGWWPSKEEFDPKLSKKDWKKFIVEDEKPKYPACVRMLKAMMELGGEASCKELSIKYGGHPSVYAACTMNIGRHVKSYYNLPTCMDGDKERYFPFPFLGKYNGSPADNYIYKIRPELYEALNEIDLSDISPYYANEHRTGHFDSWEIIDDITAIKTCDKSFFAYNGSGVPKEICWFFDAEDIPTGGNKSVKFIFEGKEFIGKLTNDTTDRRRIQIRWNSDLTKNLEQYKTDDAKAKFVKTEDGIYEITMEEGENKMAVTVLDNIIQAMKNIGGKGSYSEIYTAYEKLTGQILTDGKKAGIRGTIERNSSDSDVFSGNDIFYSVSGKGKGVWGLRNYNGERQISIKDKINNIKSYIATKGFNYEGDLIENFYLSLKSKPFVILAGTSGTGKTKLVKLFAEAIGAEMKLVPVRPDWSDSSDLFGHVDLAGNFKAGAIIDFVKKAEIDKDKPYFLCLDEMNLARVEYYLSDFLSIIETRDRVNGEIITDPLVSEEYYQNETAKEEYGKLIIPENLYIIGTVNMDETTFPFSKKVLDRANTIEFSFVNFMPKEQVGSSASVLQLDNSFLKTKYLYFNEIEDEEFKSDICFKLEELNEALRKANLHVGYRVRDEISFYMINNKECELLDENAAFDNEIMQKILPRIQGSSGAIKQLLCDLFVLCAGDYSGFTGSSICEQMSSYVAMKDCKYPNTANKIVFMMRRYEEDGFTSYWL